MWFKDNSIHIYLPQKFAYTKSIIIRKILEVCQANITIPKFQPVVCTKSHYKDTEKIVMRQSFNQGRHSLTKEFHISFGRRQRKTNENWNKYIAKKGRKTTSNKYISWTSQIIRLDYTIFDYEQSIFTKLYVKSKKSYIII